MWFYEGTTYEPSEAVKNLFLLHKGELSVEKIVNIFQEGIDFFVEVKWRGFSEDMNTIQSLKDLYEDLPYLVKEYVNATNTKVNRAVRKAIVKWQQEIDAKRALGVNN